VNLNRSNTSANTFGIPAGLGTLLGIKSDRTYNVKNIAAYLGPNNELPNRRSNFLWGSNGLTGANILANGIYVSLAGVPGSDAAWGTAPFEPQYLKLYDVTPPPSVLGAPTVTPPYSVPGSATRYTTDGTATVSWAAVADTEELTPRYRITVRRQNNTVVSNLETGNTSADLFGLAAGESYTFTVTALNPNDPNQTSAASTTSGSIVSLTATGDDDGDGQSNAAELVAGTDPQNASKRFSIESITRPSANSLTITWTPVAGRTYRVEAKNALGSETWVPIATGLTSGSHTENSLTESARFYRVVVE